MFHIDTSVLDFVLALQDLPRDLPGEATQPIGPGDDAAERRGDPAGMMNLFYILMLVLLAMIIFSILGNRRERKKRESMIASIKKHDKVQTIGGVIGSIVELKPDFVVLKVDESSNTRITFARSAIQQVIKSSTTGQKEKEIEQPQE
jgi:preprotein translocase subunit YajC